MFNSLLFFIFVLFFRAESCTANASGSFHLKGGNHLYPNFYYQFTVNDTVYLELRDGDTLTTKKAVETIMVTIKYNINTQFVNVTEFAGNLIDQNGTLLGRLNCQFTSWSCQDAIKIIHEYVNSACELDETYTGGYNPRIEICEWFDDGYLYFFKIKDTIMVETDNIVEDYKTAIKQIDLLRNQSFIYVNNYTLQHENITLGVLKGDMGMSYEEKIANITKFISHSKIVNTSTTNSLR